MILNLVNANFGIYSSLRPLDTIGVVYPIIDISDKWGFLKVTDKGCLISNKRAIITAENIKIEEQIISGNGWNLKLNENWIIMKQQNNYLVKEKNHVR